uniref:F-box/kelch-repeat protein At3g18720-like n=1 Tax=Erigeron canadensis TaxID=72917 RepID=UPI001CB9BCB6|nr:F-box/kelch-repeat protein At3g18720-like [Erigeron canadensis]
MDRVIYSYHLKSKTISPSLVPSLMVPTSHMSMWECRLDDDHREAKFMVDSKQEKDETVGFLMTDNEVNDSESRLLDLPFDVLERIMIFCVGVEYLNFRATCKHLYQATPVIPWRNQTALQDYSLVSPWLMVVDQIQGIITFTDPMMGDNYYMRSPQLSIADEIIYSSRFGWLLFQTSALCPVFFNPFTNDLRKLPEFDYYISTYCFSDPPTSPDCMVVGFSNKKIIIHYVAREPTCHVFDLVTDSQLRPIRFLTFLETDLYALYKTGELMVFKDFSEKDISWEILKTEAPRSCSKSPAQYFLVKRDQHLLLVVMGWFGEPMEVFKLNDSTGEWEKVNGLGKHMIYICDTTCLCIEAKTPAMENKIFLAQLSSENKKIVFYSLDTCTFHTFNGKSVQENVGGVATTTYLSAHTWIEPSWSLHYPPKEGE